jgi:hypothetical protein
MWRQKVLMPYSIFELIIFGNVQDEEEIGPNKPFYGAEGIGRLQHQ